MTGSERDNERPYEGTPFHRWIWEQFERWERQNPRATQAEFARRLGISPTSLTYYLQGARLPDRRSELSIAEGLGIDVNEVRKLVDDSVKLAPALRWAKERRLPIRTQKAGRPERWSSREWAAILDIVRRQYEEALAEEQKAAKESEER